MADDPPPLFGAAGRSRSDEGALRGSSSLTSVEARHSQVVQQAAGAPVVVNKEFSERREGWLIKNHQGGSFAKNKRKRWFLSDGFHVEYYEDEGRKKRAGRFDLRNVIGLRPSTDPDVQHGLDVLLSESAKGKLTKTITISFEEAAAGESADWTALWASAVEPAHLDEALRGSRSERLARHLNQTCWGQGSCISSLRREMSTKSNLILNPRAPDHDPAYRRSLMERESSFKPSAGRKSQAGSATAASATAIEEGDGDEDDLPSPRTPVTPGSPVGAGAFGEPQTPPSAAGAESAPGARRSSGRALDRLSGRASTKGATLETLKESSSNISATLQMPPAIPLPATPEITSPTTSFGSGTSVPSCAVSGGPRPGAVAASLAATTAAIDLDAKRIASGMTQGLISKSLATAISQGDAEGFSDVLQRTTSEMAAVAVELEELSVDGDTTPRTSGVTSGSTTPTRRRSSANSMSSHQRLSMALESSGRNGELGEEAQLKALKRFTRPRMGSSMTLALPSIEREAEDLGAGRFRVPVPDGLEQGEELVAILPSGRAHTIKLPAADPRGSKQNRFLVFFTDMNKLVWQSTGELSSSSC